MKRASNFIFVIYYLLVVALSVWGFWTTKSINMYYFAISSALVGVILQMFLNSFFKEYREQKEEIVNILKNIPIVEILHEESFYNKFTQCINSSTHNVDIAHLGLAKPTNLKTTVQSQYYKKLKEYVKQNPAVTFRRVERVSIDKIDWIELIMKDFKGIKNFSLYCFYDNSNEMSDLLSIQRIDETHSFIVAMNEHNSTRGSRDIYIRDKNVTEFFIEYYNNRLINRSRTIISKGKVDFNQWESIKKTL